MTMSEGTPSTLFLVWTIVAAFSLVALASVPLSTQLLLTPFVLEWVLIGLTGVVMMESDDDLQQRENETNARYAIRAWLTIHVFIVKMPFMAIVALPKTTQRVLSWLRETPKDTNGG